MKKKGSIVCLLVVMMMLSMVGCSNKPNASVEATSVDGKVKLEFEEKGIYVLSALGKDAWIYQFDEPNATIVVYKTVDGIYLIGEDSEKKGTSYGNIFMPNGEFIALSNEYLLFETEEGKIAIAIEKRMNVAKGESLYTKREFDELTEEEKMLFIYPVNCEKNEK